MLASGNNLEGKCLLFFLIVCLYFAPRVLFVSFKDLSYILHVTFYILHFMYVHYVCIFYLYKFIFLIL